MMLQVIGLILWLMGLVFSVQVLLEMGIPEVWAWLGGAVLQGLFTLSQSLVVGGKIDKLKDRQKQLGYGMFVGCILLDVAANIIGIYLLIENNVVVTNSSLFGWGNEGVVRFLLSIFLGILIASVPEILYKLGSER